jgi:predicted HAD superfamily Cof-like phosphohydrolase
MLTNYDKVRDFHTAFDVSRFEGTYSELLSLLAKRHALLQEEFMEGQAALMMALQYADNMTHERYVQMVDDYLDSLADVLYVAYGSLELLGVDGDAVFDEVHSSNMSKLNADGKPIKDPETGKIKKGPSYTAPDLSMFVDEVMSNVTNRVE